MGKRSEFERVARDYSGANNNCYRHGHNQRGQRSPEYKIWVGIRKRVNDVNCNIYPYYGGRGITYDPLWESFIQFFYDVGPKPSDKHTLDRVDPDGHYVKDNVRWVTRAEQSRNKRNNIFVEGLVLKDWCKLKGYNYRTVWRWIAKENCLLEDVVKKGEMLWGKDQITL